MILRLLTLPITGPLEGIAWIGEQILERAEAELDSTENLHKKLLALQLAFDLGDISEEDFEQQEEELLLAIEAMEASKDDE
ncbi:MAG TPA: gas vesicle protein GvpG [Oscillatoriaceae cyanobacterium M33_DOE_052]|uniref:Gas vesicle protein GvpG n=1 Tax=Planktothricoides sp. SpSt-374 TaxID=2282167 RepID=A0A7C3VK25_9CYAN|nr:gas vesicle protein GvpG [Oscillatoriaceae cyanobacterium M33_DOE_052]